MNLNPAPTVRNATLKTKTLVSLVTTVISCLAGFLQNKLQCRSVWEAKGSSICGISSISSPEGHADKT